MNKELISNVMPGALKISSAFVKRAFRSLRSKQPSQTNHDNCTKILSYLFGNDFLKSAQKNLKYTKNALY